MSNRTFAALRRFLEAPKPYQCPHCGHWWGLSGSEGPPHDRTACEVAKLRRDVDPPYSATEGN